MNGNGIVTNSSGKRKSRRRSSPQVVYGGIALGVAALVALLLYFWLGWNFYWLWLLTVNVVAFVFYRYDKRQAQHEGAMRVPEVVLLLLTLVGGFVGAGAGMYMRPHHKTRKPKFVATLVIGALIQVVIIYLLYLR